MQKLWLIKNTYFYFLKFCLVLLENLFFYLLNKNFQQSYSLFMLINFI